MKDGYFDGKWTATNSVFGSLDGVEYFQDGMFIKGLSKEMDKEVPYTDPARTSLYEFIPQENLNFYTFSINCPGFSINPPRYRDTYTFNGAFYPELISKIEEQVDIKNTANQWFIITFNVSKEKQLNSLKIKSSLDNQPLAQKLKAILNSFTDWTKEGILNGNGINFPFYMTIVFEDGSLIIPDFHLN